MIKSVNDDMGKTKNIFVYFSPSRDIPESRVFSLVPIPLTVFQSNSKFDQSSQCSGLVCGKPINSLSPGIFEQNFR